MPVSLPGLRRYGADLQPLSGAGWPQAAILLIVASLFLSIGLIGVCAVAGGERSCPGELATVSKSNLYKE